MNTEKKQVRSFIGAFGLAVLILVLFSSSTSPLFDIVYSDYYNNPSSTGFFVGKMWEEGMLPYKDLYVVNGPLYYFIQMIGWNIGERTGILLIQIIFLTLGLWFLYQIFSELVREKICWILMIITSVFFVGTLNGGNAPSEFCFTLSVVAIYIAIKILKNSDSDLIWNYFLLGILTGAVLMIQVTCGGAIYGIAIWGIVFLISEKKQKGKVKKIVASFCGILTVVIPFFIYFYMYDALNEMINCSFVQSIRFLWVEAFSTKLLLHKFVKSLPSIFLMVASIYYYKKDKKMYGLFIGISVCLVIFSVTGQGYWYQYIPTIMALPLLLVELLRDENVIDKRLPIVLGVIFSLGIVILPLKNYVSFIRNEGIMVYHDLINQINEYQEKIEDNCLFLVDVPAFVYLETGSVPSHYYFVQHTEYNKVNTDMRAVVTDYMTYECQDPMAVIQGTGGTYIYIGHYEMINNYYYDRTMLYVYEYVDEITEHSHE